MNNWRDIETAPKDGTPVFLWKNQFIGVHRYLNPLGSVCGPQWYQAYGCNYAAFWVEGATDWMPLPQPPATTPASEPQTSRDATASGIKLTKAQLSALRWAKRKYEDGRVPPYVFRDHRSISRLIEAGLIEPWVGYGAPMYKLTHKGLDALEAA